MQATKTQSGAASVLAMFFLALFAALGIAFATATNRSLLQADSHAGVQSALLQAEGGLDFMIRELDYVRLPLTTTEDTVVADLGAALAQRLDATGNLAGQNVTVLGSEVTVPEIDLPYGAFSCMLWPAGSGRCALRVLGRSRTISRTVGIDLALVARQSRVFDYGLVSYGPLSITGGARIVGVNHPMEASILAAATDVPTSATLAGNAVVSGDITLVGDSNIAISGTPSLGGTSDPAKMAHHIHSTPEAPEVPAVDTAPFAPLATNVVNSGTDTATPGLTFNNIRIVAGTNPTFASDVVINGVVYIDAPNTVTFSGRTTINGMIVTEDAVESLQSCQINFDGQVEARGVQALPDTAEFAGIKEHTGTFVLAPSFSVTFAGQFSAINGTIAADQLTFTGQSEGILNGAVIGLTSEPMQLDGNVEIRVDRTSGYPDPAGFVKTIALEAQPVSYTEPIGG